MSETKQQNPEESLAKMKAQLDQAEERAKSAERLLEKAKEELLTFSTSESKEKLQERLDLMQEQNRQSTLALRKLLTDMEELQREATHWRSRFLMSEIDVVSATDRADKAEKKLSEAVKPLPYSQQQLIKERELSWMAFIDPVTGLGNANKLDLVLKSLVPKTLSEGRMMALLLVDIDKFRQLTEFAGWDEADALLKMLAQRVAEKVPQDTTFVRRGEDDFALVVVLDPPGQANMGESPLIRCRQIADFIMQLVSTPFQVKHQKYPITISIGISISPDDADSPAELMANAYAALSTAKERGGNQYIIFSDRVYQDKEGRANLAAELKEALGGDQLMYLFRPIADLQAGNLAGAMVEPYWEHASHGRVGLDAFMPLAEEHGMMPGVVKQMIGAACELSRKMKGSIQIMVRCPSAVLQMAGFAKHVMDAVSAARINPKSIGIEIPGDNLNTNPKDLTALFSQLSKWGVGCAVRFDTKSATHIQALLHCHVSMIILAADLVESVPAQEGQRAVMQSYLDMGVRLNIPVLVQGVKENSQSHFLALHKAAFATGDFISLPYHLAEFVSRRRQTWKFR